MKPNGPPSSSRTTHSGSPRNRKWGPAPREASRSTRPSCRRRWTPSRGVVPTQERSRGGSTSLMASVTRSASPLQGEIARRVSCQTLEATTSSRNGSLQGLEEPPSQGSCVPPLSGFPTIRHAPNRSANEADDSPATEHPQQIDRDRQKREWSGQPPLKKTYRDGLVILKGEDQHRTQKNQEDQSLKETHGTTPHVVPSDAMLIYKRLPL